MRVLKNILSQLHLYLLWLILSAVLWGFVYGLITDAPAEKKLVIYADVYACRDRELAEELEKTMPAGLKMIRVHPFDYAMFSDSELLNADLYLVPESRAGDYLDSYSPLDGAALPWPEAGLWCFEGVAYGVSFQGAASYIDYAPPGEQAEPYYLFFGVNSAHTASLNGSADDAALAVAQELSLLP